MRYLILLLLLALCSCVAASAQNAKPSPPADGEVVKITTNLIQLDVTVTDKKGNPIPDLRAEEIEVYENGKKQKISNFSFISSISEKIETPKKKEVPTIDIPVPRIELKTENVRRTFALLVDDLTLSFESAYYTRNALKKFVDQQMQDGDLVAIIRTGAGLGSLQQFTSDKKLLYAAIERVRWNPMGTGGVGAFAAIEPTPLEESVAAGNVVSDEDLEAERNRINSGEDFRASIFASGTLGAIRYVINGMSRLPGRKSIILFSDGFRMFPRDEEGHPENGMIFELMRKLVDQANRASVVINTIDSRGLVYTGYTAADNVTDTSAEAMMRSMSDRSDQLFETQQGLAFLAEETGGLAIRNNNDLSGGVRKILDDQSYYLVAYEPEDETFDANKVKFNKISVRVTRKDATVRTRSGFFSVASPEAKAAEEKAPTPFRQLMDALSSPFAQTGIQLRLNPLVANDPKQGTYVKSYLHIDAGDLKFTDAPDGKKKATITIIAAAFGDSGVPVAQISRSYAITVKPDGMKSILDDGFVYDFTFPMKNPGGFQYRVAIRDDQSGTVGSASQFVQIPKIKKGRPVLSGIVLQNYTAEQWQQASKGTGAVKSDAVNDTSARKFRRGTVLQYAAEIYGLDAKSAADPRYTRKIRVYRNGKLVLDGKDQPLDARTAGGKFVFSSALSLGSGMQPGEYVLQMIVVDNEKKDQKKYATQVAQFELTN
jgi:VWFA-related protein